MKVIGFWWKLKLVYRLLALTIILLLSVIPSIVTLVTYIPYKIRIYYSFLVILFSFVLFISGAFRFSLRHFLLGFIVIYSFSFFLILLTFDYHELIHVMVFIFAYFISVLLITQGIKITEWIYIGNKINKSGFVNAIIISASVAYNSLTNIIKKAFEVDSLSRITNWGNKNNRTKIISSKIQAGISRYETMFLAGAITTKFITKSYRDWRRIIQMENAKKLNYILPHEIYELSSFAQIYDEYTKDIEVDKEWKIAISNNIVKDDHVLDIGAGSGRTLKELQSKSNVRITAIENNKYFYDEAIKTINDSNIKFVLGKYPNGIERGINFDKIIMYHNVFLELWNEEDGEYIVNCLANNLKKGGKMILDFPDRINLPEKNKFISVLKNLKTSLGIVNYGFRLLESNSDLYTILVEIEIEDKEIKSHHSQVMQIRIPHIDNVIEKCKEYDLSLINKDSDIIDTNSFIPGEMNLLVFERVR